MISTSPSGGSAGPSLISDLDASANPNYPAASRGERYRITVAGKVGGASGKVVEAGDVIEAIATNAGGTEASVGSSWIALQANIAGMTAAGLSMITAADAAAQAALLTALMPKAGSAFTGLTGAGFRDTSAAFDVTLGFTSSVALTAGRTLTIDMGNVAHTINLGTTAGTITFPNAAAVTVAGLQIANGFTAAQTITLGTNTAVPVTALSYINGTAATVGVQSASPAAIFSGFGWKTDATAASQAVAMKQFVLPVQGAASPTVLMQYQYSVNAGAYADVISFGLINTRPTLYIGGVGSATNCDLFLAGSNGGRIVDTGGNFTLDSAGIRPYTTSPFSWSTANAAQIFGNIADTVAIRNSTRAQKLEVYGTYTDASNYVRLGINTTSTTLAITCETSGTGADDIDLLLTPAGAGLVKFGTYTADLGVVLAGSINIKTADGTIRKVAIVG